MEAANAEQGITDLWLVNGRVFAKLADGSVVGGNDPPPAYISLDGGKSYLTPGTPEYKEYLASLP